MEGEDVPTSNQIKEQLEKNWFKFLNDNSARFSLRTLSGATPPSVFVGRFGYPKVKVGPMVPPVHGDTAILDTPEIWLGKSMEEIVNYRFSLVRGVSSVDIHSPCGKYVESLQELAMTSNPVESEITFEKAPIAVTGQAKEFGLDTSAAPFGPIAPLITFKTSSPLSVDQRLEDVFYDKDLCSTEGIINLYQSSYLMINLAARSLDLVSSTAQHKKGITHRTQYVM